jgi:hypothetical protein
MKNALYILIIGTILFSSCKDDELKVFDKTADERVAEAITALKQDLVSAPHGWKVKYNPVEGSGSYYIFLDFEENNTVNIKSDFSENEGKYYDQNITYRIDNSLGLELIFESGSVFSYLYDLNQGTFPAEYEFDYVNKTPDDALVFQSKSDPRTSVRTTLVLEAATDQEVNSTLGIQLSNNLNVLEADFDKFSSSLEMTFAQKDLVFYISHNTVIRQLTFSLAAKKSNTASTQNINFTTTYYLKGDSIVFDETLQGTFLGYPITISSLKLNTLSEATAEACGNPITLHGLQGLTSSSDAITFSSTLHDLSGAGFASESTIYFCPPGNIFNNGVSVGHEVAQNITGAASMQLYYNYDLGDDVPFFGLGFAIQNSDGTSTFALRQFTSQIIGNNIVFTFEEEISIFENPETDANIENINIYINQLTQGNQTYVFKLSDGLYEFYNPCNGWSFVFFN